MIIPVSEELRILLALSLLYCSSKNLKLGDD